MIPFDPIDPKQSLTRRQQMDIKMTKFLIWTNAVCAALNIGVGLHNHPVNLIIAAGNIILALLLMRVRD